MTRQDVLNEYDTNEQGVITTPGKFEGEMLYVPYFWELVLDGSSDDVEVREHDNVDIDVFTIGKDDLKEFPELNNINRLKLWESNNGFVYSEVDTD